jgi:TolB-like protein/DNA-binding winged helix-turn-helix (wHTH) protein/Tfp pilus assembly protein PilF
MASPATVYRFGPFELRPRARELYKNSIKLKLRPQPFRVLEVLLDRRGDVVTRDELRQLLWESETFVDFEQGLNTAVKELRSALNDSADTPRYVETIPRVGYRIIAPVEVEVLASKTPAEPGQPELKVKSTLPDASASVARTGPTLQVQTSLQREPLSSRFPLSFGWTALVVVAAVLLIGLPIYWAFSHRRVAAQPPGGRLMLAVLPFQNLTGDPSQEYFSDGLTEEMISQLGRLDPQRMGVIARTSVMHYKQNPTPLDQVGRELGVEYVMEGSVRRDANTVRVSAQLIQVKNQTHLWSRQYDRELSGLLAVQQEIAQEIADEIQLTLGDKRSGSRNGGSATASSAANRPTMTPPASYEAYDFYLKGRFFWNKRTAAGLHQAADYFQEAIDKDPNYAAAYAGLADTYALLSTWNYVPSKDFMPKARDAALKALQIDDTQPEAHASLALIAEQYDYDWQTAEKEFRRAIQLDPDYATGHQWYAECLAFLGRFDEAFAESERARQLDPLSLIIATDHAVILYYSRQYDRAIEQFRAVREMEPDFPRAGLIVNAYVADGHFADAVAQLESPAGVRFKAASPPAFFATETYIYGRWGRHPEAVREFAKFEAELKRHPSDSNSLPIESWMLLESYLGMQRNDDAIAVLEKAFALRTSALISIKVDPMCDPLRNAPRFQDLLSRAHFNP